MPSSLHIPFSPVTSEEQDSTEPQSVDFDKTFEEYRKTKDTNKLRALVDGLTPHIEAVLKPLGKINPVLMGKARVQAAKAIKTYDPTKGAKLPTWVGAQLRSVIRDAPTIQEPFLPSEGFRRDSAELNNRMRAFSDQFGREPTDEELADTSGIPLKRVIKLRTASRARIPYSVAEESSERDESPSAEQVVHSHNPYDDWSEAVYYGLGDIDKLIFMHRTGYRGADVLPTNAIAQRLNLSPAVVSARAKKIQQQLDSFHA
jgi:DNA-directed RNA polymerase specialized sigma subunit